MSLISSGISEVIDSNKCAALNASKVFFMKPLGSEPVN